VTDHALDVREPALAHAVAMIARPQPATRSTVTLYV